MGNQHSGSDKGPHTSQSNDSGAAIKYLPRQNWPFEELLHLIECTLEVDCTYCLALAFPPHAGRFAIVTLTETGKGKAQEYPIECVGDRMLLDSNTLGDILANLAFGGAEAVNLYISSRGGVGRRLSPSKPKEVLIAKRPLFGTQ
jgi:hypothetical protein